MDCDSPLCKPASHSNHIARLQAPSYLCIIKMESIWYIRFFYPISPLWGEHLIIITHTQYWTKRLLWMPKPKRFPMILLPEKRSQNLRQANSHPPGPRRWYCSVRTWTHCPPFWNMVYCRTLSRRLLIHFSLLWEAMLLWKAQWAGKLMKSLSHTHTHTCTTTVSSHD